MVRIIGAELAIAPQGQPEVELGVMPLDVYLPAPPTGMQGAVTVRLTLHTSRGDQTMRWQWGLVEANTPGLTTPGPSGVSRAQYRALLRSVERSYEFDPTDGESPPP